MKFKGIDGIHLLRFSAFESAGYQVGWDEADYPTDCEHYLTERESSESCWGSLVTNQTQWTYFFPACMDSQTSTILCTQPALLVVESLWDLTEYLLLKGGHASPHIGPVIRPEVLIWCQMNVLIEDLLDQLMVVHPSLCQVLGAKPLSIILNQPPSLLVPLLLVLFLLFVFTVVNVAILPGNSMTLTDPAHPILYRDTHLHLLLLIHCLFLTGNPFLAIPLLPLITFNQKYPTIPRE